MLANVGQNVKNVWIRPVDEKWIKVTSALYYYPKAIHLEKYDYDITFLDAALNPFDPCASVFPAQTEVLYIRPMVWNAASMSKIS